MTCWLLCPADYGFAARLVIVLVAAAITAVSCALALLHVYSNKEG